MRNCQIFSVKLTVKFVKITVNSETLQKILAKNWWQIQNESKMLFFNRNSNYCYVCRHTFKTRVIKIDFFQTLVDTSIFVFSLILILQNYQSNGLKCTLKGVFSSFICFSDFYLQKYYLGLVNNRVQCILHDRGINPYDTSENSTANLIKRMRHQTDKPDENAWKHTYALDANKTFFGGSSNPDDFKKYVRTTVTGTKRFS